MESHILANAELVRKVAREQLGVSVEYDESGVRWLDKYIDLQRANATDEVKARLPNTLGSFLGESIRQTYGGNWVNDPEYGWMVKINEGVSVYPFHKVTKHLANENGDSVLGLFTAIPGMIDFASRQKPKPVGRSELERRPWWKFW